MLYVMEEARERLKLLADPTRFRILQFLAEPQPSLCRRDDGVCGCDLEGFLGFSQPTVSYHMKLLVEAGLVCSERSGPWVHYRLAPDAFRSLVGVLEVFADAAETSAGDRPPTEVAAS